jgi:hypothetical protein
MWSVIALGLTIIVEAVLTLPLWDRWKKKPPTSPPV